MEPKKTTTYRWYLPSIGYADASRSGQLTVVVVQELGEQPAQTSGGGSSPSGQDDSQSDAGRGQRRRVASQATTERRCRRCRRSRRRRAPEPTDPPTDEPTDEPTAEPIADPDRSAR